MRILEEIGLHLPGKGRILDIGCGFGLFTLYYATLSADRHFYSIDLNRSRITMAHAAGAALDVSARVSFCVQDASTIGGQPGTFEAAYMLDLIHHLPRAQHRSLLAAIYKLLAPNGVLVIKDIATYPRWKMFFTWVLDMVMSPRMPPHYVDPSSLCKLLAQIGFTVETRPLPDILPYPHILYICRKGSAVP
jgi:cyclopropane fatty-acyl-phospholipid synthase-like methyltransferase